MLIQQSYDKSLFISKNVANNFSESKNFYLLAVKIYLDISKFPEN